MRPESDRPDMAAHGNMPAHDGLRVPRSIVLDRSNRDRAIAPRFSIESFSRRFQKGCPFAGRLAMVGGRPPSKGVPMNVSHRLGRSLVWRCVRLAGAILARPLVLWACTSHPLEAPQPLPDVQTDDFYAVNPIRD